jgi:predicted TIM-barrel fold metal-dependent hydrolase
MRIIDCRLRPPSHSFLTTSYFTDVERISEMARAMHMTPPASFLERSMDLLLTEMDETGIESGLVAGRISPALGGVSNEDVAAICADNPEKFIGLAVIDPANRRTAVDTIDRYMAQGFKGALLEPGLLGRPLAIDDRRLYPFYAHCEDRNVPVFIMAGGNAGPDAAFTNPEHIDRVAADFPNLKLVSLHGSWPWVIPILHVCFRRPNVYVCPDMYLLGRMAGYQEYVAAGNSFLADRLLFATSYPVIPLAQSVTSARALGFTDHALERFLSINAIELLGLQ